MRVCAHLNVLTVKNKINMIFINGFAFGSMFLICLYCKLYTCCN